MQKLISAVGLLVQLRPILAILALETLKITLSFTNVIVLM